MGNDKAKEKFVRSEPLKILSSEIETSVDEETSLASEMNKSMDEEKEQNDILDPLLESLGEEALQSESTVKASEWEKESLSDVRRATQVKEGKIPIVVQ